MICVLTRVILSRNLDSWRQIINDPEDLLPIPVNGQKVSFGFDTWRVDGDGTSAAFAGINAKKTASKESAALALALVRIFRFRPGKFTAPPKRSGISCVHRRITPYCGL